MSCAREHAVVEARCSTTLRTSCSMSARRTRVLLERINDKIKSPAGTMLAKVQRDGSDCLSFAIVMISMVYHVSPSFPSTIHG